jgi:hypothetical protein
VSLDTLLVDLNSPFLFNGLFQSDFTHLIG